LQFDHWNEFRWAEGHYERFADMAADLVRREVSVSVANTPANLAAKRATSTIPIVFPTASDPVQIGLVPNLNRPRRQYHRRKPIECGDWTETAGVGASTDTHCDLGRVSCEPQRRFTRAETLTKDAQATAVPLGLTIHVLPAFTDAEIEAAFAGFAQLKAGVLVIGADALFNSKSELLTKLSLRYAVPAIYQYSEFADAGGLLSYGGSIKESYRAAGIYTARILKGERPGDLPVQQSTTVELIVNLKTAKALGISVPLPLLGRADKVIE
jgi:putative ABC transport system substrate-binding protein